MIFRCLTFDNWDFAHIWEHIYVNCIRVEIAANQAGFIIDCNTAYKIHPSWLHKNENIIVRNIALSALVSSA